MGFPAICEKTVHESNERKSLEVHVLNEDDCSSIYNINFARKNDIIFIIRLPVEELLLENVDSRISA
jgi:hypothetical protein